MKVTVAIIGTGSIGSRHLEVLARIPSVDTIAIPNRRDRISELQMRGFRTAINLHQAIQQGATIGIIATDTGKHLENGLQALDCGMDVLIEKPLAKNRMEADCLRQRSESTGHSLFVACVLRFSESLTKFRELLPQIGNTHSVRIESQSYLPDWRPQRPYQDSYSAREDEGGVLRDLIHEIDFAGWIFGWPVSLQSRVKNIGRLGISSDESADLIWETQDGCSVSVRLDYLTTPPRRKMTAFGENGTVEWDGLKMTVTLTTFDGRVELHKSTQSRNEMLLEQAAAFINSFTDNPHPQLATGEDGVKALAVCDAARRASKSRQEELVDYP